MQHAAERVERPGESLEALDGKKGLDKNLLHFKSAPLILMATTARPRSGTVLIWPIV